MRSQNAGNIGSGRPPVSNTALLCKHRYAVVLLIAALLALVSGARAEPATSPTLRIITCAPNLTEMVFAMEGGGDVVAVSRYTHWPPAAMELPQVVDFATADLEAMLRLRPTHVIALESNRAAIEFFRNRSGVILHVAGRTETLTEIEGTFLGVAAQIGRTTEARAFLAARPRPANFPLPDRPPRVLWVLGGGGDLSQLYVVGRGTYLSELLEMAGGENVVPERLGIYPVLNKELLFTLAPEIILIVARPDAAADAIAEAKRAWAPLSPLPAVRRGDFRVLASMGVLTPGPRVLGHLPALHHLLHSAGAGAIVAGDAD